MKAENNPGEIGGLAGALSLVGGAMFSMGLLEEAEAAYKELLAIPLSLSELHSHIHALDGLVEIMVEKGNQEKALEYAKVA